MSMEHHDLAGGHALGILDEEERLAFEAHLASGCAECEAALRDARAVVDALAAAAEPFEPRAQALAGLMARVRGETERVPARRSAPPSRRRQQLLAAGAAAALALAAIAGWRTVDLGADLDRTRVERQGLVQALTEAKAELASSRDERRHLGLRLSSLSETLDAVANGPGGTVIPLVGPGPLPAARGLAFLDYDHDRLLVHGFHMPDPADRVYQLWILSGKRAISAGTFEIGQNGNTRLERRPIPILDTPPSLAVTIEPAGGGARPTGPIVLGGSAQ